MREKCHLNVPLHSLLPCTHASHTNDIDNGRYSTTPTFIKETNVVRQVLESSVASGPYSHTNVQSQLHPLRHRSEQR